MREKKLQDYCLNEIMSASRHPITRSGMHVIKVVFVRFWKLSEFCCYIDDFLQQLISESTDLLEAIINTGRIFLVLLWYLLNSYTLMLCSVTNVQNVENMLLVFWKVLWVPGFWSHFTILPVLKGCLGNSLLTSPWMLHYLRTPLLVTLFSLVR